MLPFLSKNQKKLKWKEEMEESGKKKEVSAFKANSLFQKVLREIWKAAVCHNIMINLLKWKEWNNSNTNMVFLERMSIAGWIFVEKKNA